MKLNSDLEDNAASLNCFYLLVFNFSLHSDPHFISFLLLLCSKPTPASVLLFSTFSGPIGIPLLYAPESLRVRVKGSFLL